MKKDAPLAFDSSGWPLGDCIIVVMDARVNMPWNGPDPTAVPEDIHGTYAFSCTGQCKIEPGDEVPNSFRCENLFYDPATKTTTASIVLAKGQNLFMLKLKNTIGGVKNVRIIRPGYPADTTQLFTTAYIQALKPFALVRFMEFLNVNNYPIWEGKKSTKFEWSMRRLPADATQVESGNKRGAALEYAIALANETGQDLWVNVPATATDDYVAHMAALLHQQVKPGLHIYVEYANEVWNYAFKQAIYAKARAKAEVAEGHSTLNNDGAKSEEDWQSRFYTRRVVEISKIFQQEFGPDCLGARLRPVLVWQVGTAGHVGALLNWVAKNFGDPRQYIWGVGDGSYYTPTDCSSVDAIFKTQKIASDKLKADTIAFAKLAKQFGMHRVAYEGGSDMTGPSDLANKIAASRDPRMAESVRHHLMDNYFSCGGEIFCYYDLNHGYGPYGNYGLVDRDVTKLDSPKYQGAMQVLAELKADTTK
jgi:hypothetical protein